MARKYSRKKGTSGSKKPFSKALSSWLSYKPKEVEAMIAKLAKENNSASIIGLKLRDSYGIMDVKKITGKTITKILKEKKMTKKMPEDLTNLMKRALQIRKHIETNHGDKTAKRGLQITESKIRRLSKYYKKSGHVDEDWNYDPERAGLFIE